MVTGGTKTLTIFLFLLSRQWLIHPVLALMNLGPSFLGHRQSSIIISTPYLSPGLSSPAVTFYRSVPSYSRHVAVRSTIVPNDDPDESIVEWIPLENSSIRNPTSPLALMEHVNLNVPDHEHILKFYIDVLGFGLDPRTAANVEKGFGMVWVNCGACQIHLPKGDVAQVLPGSIGLRYDDIGPLKRRLASYDETNGEDKAGSGGKSFEEYSVSIDPSGSECVRIVDRYGNVFYCRAARLTRDIGNNDPLLLPPLIDVAFQPFVQSSDPDHILAFPNSASSYGLDAGITSTECTGISYVEFNVPCGTAGRVAEFYRCVFDAPASLIEMSTAAEEERSDEDTSRVAVVGVGSIDPDTGRSDQSLIFRETHKPLPPYDGHHIALYAGDSFEVFANVLSNAMDAGVVWVNPRFADKVVDLDTARRWNQFRFRDVLDLESGETIFRVEHEIRSMLHSGWPLS